MLADNLHQVLCLSQTLFKALIISFDLESDALELATNQKTRSHVIRVEPALRDQDF